VKVGHGENRGTIMYRTIYVYAGMWASMVASDK